MKTTSFSPRVALIAGVCGMGAPILAAPHTPAKGSSERTALMNAVRPSLGSGKHKPIITANHLKVERGWAYMTGGFSYEGGAPLEEQWQEGSGTNFSALLQKQGSRWKLKRQVYNGDVVEPDFIRAFPQAPRSIFK